MHSPNRVIFVYIIATFIFTSLTLGFYFYAVAAGQPHGLWGFLHDPDGGSDLTRMSRLTRWPQQGALVLQGKDDEMFNYCPLSIFIFASLLSSFSHPVKAQIIIIGTFALIAAGILCFRVASNRAAVFAILLAVCTSYPFFFLFLRGNIEGFVWIPCVAAIFFLNRTRYLPAASFVAIAACIKPFPSMLMLLLLPRRRYRDFILGCALAIGIALTALAIVGPSLEIAIRENLAGFRAVQERYVLTYRASEVFADHSLFSLFKQVLRLAVHWPPAEILSPAIQAAYPYYQALAVTISAASVFRLAKLPAINQIFGLVTLMMLIPPVNNDYTLVALYIPWAMLLTVLSRNGSTVPLWPATVLMVCCAVIFTSQAFLKIGFFFNLNSVMKIAALSVILLVSVSYPLPDANFDTGLPGKAPLAPAL